MVINMFLWFIVAFCNGGQLTSEVRENYSAEDTTNGYVEVRLEAHVSYRLYYADGTKKNATDKPLIIWLQGDPGFKANGLGNFGDGGPLSIDFKPKDHTWAKGRNLLFLDHPIGTGVSYAASLMDLYTLTDDRLADDLSIAILLLLKEYKTFSKTPAYVIGQSYGGKLCPSLAMYLHKAIKDKVLEMNFIGIGIGGGWINPKESISDTPTFLYESGFIDRKIFLDSTKQVDEIFTIVEKHEKMVQAHESTLSLYKKIDDTFVNLNNVYDSTSAKQSTAFTQNKYNFFNRLIPSMSSLEKVLNETNLKVAIYNGNLDALTPIAATTNWVYKLDWPFKDDFAKAKRHHMQIQGKTNGYFKVIDHLSLWTVLRAGHWIAEDHPEAMDYILEYLEAETNSVFMKTVLERNRKYFERV